MCNRAGSGNGQTWNARGPVNKNLNNRNNRLNSLMKWWWWSCMRKGTNSCATVLKTAVANDAYCLMVAHCPIWAKNGLAYFKQALEGFLCIVTWRVLLLFFNRSQETKAYFLQMDSGKVPVYCHKTSSGLGACGGDGWTLVMKINGTKVSRLHLRNIYWKKFDQK